MVVAIVISQYLGVQGHGAESHSVISFKSMLERDGHTVHLVGGEVLPPELEGPNHFVPFRYLHYPKLLRRLLHLPATIANLYLYCRRHRPDLLHNGGGVFYAGIAILIAGKRFGIPSLVRTAEDHFNYWRFAVTRRERIRHFLFTNLLSGFVLRRVDRVLTTGAASKAYFISRGVHSDRISGIPGPFLRERFRPPADRVEAKRKIGYRPEDKVILYVGGISGVKGTDELPKIMEKVLAQDASARFLIVGSEIEPGAKITRALRRAGGERVSILPPAPHEKLLEYYQGADVLVFLTKVGVGYGHVNIEASLCGLPIVAYNPGGDVEWLLGDSCTRDIDAIADRIIRGDYHPLVLPPQFDESFIRDETLKVFRAAWA